MRVPLKDSSQSLNTKLNYFFLGKKLETGQKQSFKQSIQEIWAITKASVTCFWFWVPTLFVIYLYLQFYLMVITPLLLLVGPAILIIFGLLWEEKRVKAQYGIKNVKLLYASNSLFTTPRRANSQVEVDQLVEQYKKLLKKRTFKKAAEEKEKIEE
jgi:hypothetical protein